MVIGARPQENCLAPVLHRPVELTRETPTFVDYFKNSTKGEKRLWN